MTSRQTKRAFHADDGGFSTVGMALALIVSLSLVLSAAQVYRVRSASASVQNIADACALAAEGQVASFYVAAQVCDCAVLSLSLAGALCLGLGVVVACVPSAQGVSAQLVDAGKALLDSRSRFATRAAEGLNRLQRLLPVFAALDAAAVARSNSAGQEQYAALAVLVPFQGGQIDVGPIDAADELANGIDAQRESLAQASKQSEDAARQCNEHLLRAFQADCGNAPGYCMYERAATLAGMHGSDNPRYSSPDAWSFSTALLRARAYYANRYNQERPLSDTVEEQAKSAIRKQFYAYALDQVNSGYVYDGPDGFDAYFPLLPANTQQMRDTYLYTDVGWPLSADEEGIFTLHAWEGCPGIEGEVLGYGSLSQMEADGMPRCPVCEFAASSVGKVAAASTSIDNGFEYHYRIVAQEAALYQQQRALAEAAAQAVKNPIKRLVEQVGDVVKQSMNVRISPNPPGRVGAIAVVVAAGGVRPADIVPNTIVHSSESLGTRLALSAATLAADDASETATVVSSLLDSVLGTSAAVQVPHAVLGLWSALLVMYTNGSHAIEDGLRDALDSLPLLGASGLGTWAASQLRDAVDAAGFAPPDLASYKPVVVNTIHVAQKDTTDFGKALVGAKQAFGNLYGPLPQNALQVAIGVAGGTVLARYEEWDATFVVAQVELFDGAISVPLEFTLPQQAKDGGAAIIERALDALAGIAAPVAEVRRWG